MLILISGLPGSGKSTLARAYAAHSGALHLNSDLLRRELGLMGHYQPTDKQKVYSCLFERARTALLDGRTVVIDSTLYKEHIREPFLNLAAECGVPLRWIEVRAHESTIRERLKKPRTDSEADFAAYEKIRDEADPIAGQHLIIWSDEMPLDQMVDSVVTYTKIHV